MGGHVLLKGISHGRTCLPIRHFIEGHIYWRACLTGGHVLMEDMSYMGSCFMRGHVLLEVISYRRKCLRIFYLQLLPEAAAQFPPYNHSV